MFDRYSTADIDWSVLLAAWVIATASALGSIFFSHIMAFAPCVLCWYQRICLFPLVVILARGLFPFDAKAVKYALPLAVLGWGVALYHNLLYSGVISKDLQPCAQGVSCAEKYIEFFGFVTIPLLSLLCFTLVTALLIILKKRTNSNEI